MDSKVPGWRADTAQSLRDGTNDARVKPALSSRSRCCTRSAGHGRTAGKCHHLLIGQSWFHVVRCIERGL